MKTSIFIALLATCTCLFGQGNNAAGLILKGRMAEKSGDVATARAAYTEALRLQPSNPDARYHLNELNRNAGAVAARGREKKLASVQLPAIDFRDAELKDVLDALGHMIEKESKEYAPNFMIKDPSNRFDGQRINLRLKNVPAKAILDMVLDQAGGRARYEEHAIVIAPLPSR